MRAGHVQGRPQKHGSVSNAKENRLCRFCGGRFGVATAGLSRYVAVLDIATAIEGRFCPLVEYGQRRIGASSKYRWKKIAGAPNGMLAEMVEPPHGKSTCRTPADADFAALPTCP